MVLLGLGCWWVGMLDRKSILASVSNLSGSRGSGALVGGYA